MAAAYDNPSPVDQAAMERFLYLYSRFYPCNMCAQTALQEIKRNPPRAASGPELHVWLCEFQNEVNERMGKPQFDCARTMERWRGAVAAAAGMPMMSAKNEPPASKPTPPAAAKGQ
jgi:FAD-linked sulfhydryl oxidase